MSRSLVAVRVMLAPLLRRGRIAALRRVLAVALAAAGVAVVTVPAPLAEPAEDRPRHTLFVGIDTSGSFRRAGYEDAVTFLAYYLYGHLKGLGGLTPVGNLFVAAVGGTQSYEPKAFHPIHDFAGRNVTQIEAELRRWFPPTDPLTDFNTFFREVARISRQRNLLLGPITVTVVSDGIPDVPNIKVGSPASYQKIDVRPLEYLSKSLTVRLLYASPKVGDQWRTLVTRQRVRLLAVEAEVMRGWREQMKPEAAPARQDRLWKWVRENVDYPVRHRGM